MAPCLAKSLFFVDNGTMTKSKQVIGVGVENELLGASLRERGFNFANAKDMTEAISQQPDFILIDSRNSKILNSLDAQMSQGRVSILSFIDPDMNSADLKSLRKRGSSGYLPIDLPPEEVVLHLQSMTKPQDQPQAGESRSSRRVWFQQKIEFRVYDETYHAWSTTLSETGIFLRTPLSFPLYAIIKLKFKLFGDSEPFECDGVVVRQEVEGDAKGLGVMFQNLKGESVRRLEAFFEIYS